MAAIQNLTLGEAGSEMQMQGPSEASPLSNDEGHSAEEAAAASFMEHSQSRLYPADQAEPSSRSRVGEPSTAHPTHSRCRDGCRLLPPHNMLSGDECPDEASIELREIVAGRDDGRQSNSLGALDALRVASALEDFLRMLGLHEQLHVIPSSRLLGTCKSAIATCPESSDREPACSSSSLEDSINAGHQLHVHRVLPSGRRVALSVSS